MLERQDSVKRRWLVVAIIDGVGTLDIGTGVYSLREAAAIVGRGRPVSARALRTWVDYGLSGSVRVENELLLSFQDLVSLEMVSRFRGRGISLRAIRVAYQELRARHPDVHEPFASSVFYTDGARVWTIVGKGDAEVALEIVGKVDQYAWLEAIASFATEITFSHGEAIVWRPNQWVELNPHVQFGAPVISGSRVTVSTIEANLEVGTVSEVASWYGLTVEQVQGAKAYLNLAA
jgi:uncharacterized protein (DUF433 family)/DNA-binding transcriptional MerR regulator